eukprot:jgi/Tetstr1/457808/TSEL_044353.t1
MGEAAKGVIFVPLAVPDTAARRRRTPRWSCAAVGGNPKLARGGAVLARLGDGADPGRRSSMGNAEGQGRWRPSMVPGRKQPQPPPPSPPQEGPKRAIHPQEMLRRRLFDALVQRYRAQYPDSSDLERLLQFRDASDLEKYQEQLSFTQGDFMRLVEARSLGRMLSLSEYKIDQKLSFYQQEVNVSPEELKRLVLKYPATMGYSIERTVIPHIEFFEDLGIGVEQYKRILMQAPMAALNFSIEGTLQPRVAYLQELLQSAKVTRTLGQDSKVRTERPAGSDWDNWDKQPGGRAEKPQSLAAQAILRFPQILTISEENTDEHVQFLLDLGLSEANIGTAVRKHPQILTYKIQRMEETIVYFMDVGFSDQEIPRIITRFPQVLSLSLEKNIQPKCEFYMDHISETLSPLVHTPSVLGLSLDKRIKPRYERAKAAGISIQDLPATGFPKLLYMTEVNFAKYLAKHGKTSPKGGRGGRGSGGD